MKKGIHYFITILTVFIFGFLLLHSNETKAIQLKTTDSLDKVAGNFSQGKVHFTNEGTQKESVSLKTSQSQTSSNEVVRKQQIPSFLLRFSFDKLELFYKNSVDAFFVKRNLLLVFFNTSRIIFPFHYFW